jgi:hypothetical protein
MEIIDKIEAIGTFTMDIGSWDKAAMFRRKVLIKRQKILGDEHTATIWLISLVEALEGN